MSRFTPFRIGGEALGFIRHDLAAFLAATLPDSFIAGAGSLDLASHLDNFNHRSAALAEATHHLAAHLGKKIRQEMYPVIAAWGDTPLAQIDRVAVPWFGLPAFGIHVNGYVRKTDGIYLWIGERASDRLVDPGKLDNMVGGGQPMGLSLTENLAKEAWEEAGIPAPLAATATQVNQISYRVERAEGLRNDTLFIYDLELPETFTPHNTDGEVARFHLMPLPQVAEITRTTDRFKFNCNLVVVDFLKRWGFLASWDEEAK